MAKEIKHEIEAANEEAVRRMVAADVPKEALMSTLKYLVGHELFFLGLSMAAAKATADAAR